MTHLPYSTTTPKPGDTLTAAQANSLPVGSVVSSGVNPKMTLLRKDDGEWAWEDESKWKGVRVGQCLSAKSYTLLRVGPPAPQFVVGQVVTREELDALPDGAVVDDNGNWGSPQRRTKQGGKWHHVDGSLHSPSPHWAFTIISLPSASPACPHAVGTLAWARWKAEHEGVCVRIKRSGTYRWRNGDWDGFWNKKWCGCGPGANIHNHPGPWSIVPDPSLPAETPVAVEAATNEPVERTMHILTWKGEGETVMRAFKDRDAAERHIRDLKHIPCNYYPIPAADDSCEQVATLTAERDRLRVDIDVALNTSESNRDMAQRLRAENADLLAMNSKLRAEAVDLHVEIELAKSATDNLARKLTSTETERDAAIARAERAEATEREWVAKGSQIDAEIDALRDEAQEWKQKAERAEREWARTKELLADALAKQPARVGALDDVLTNAGRMRSAIDGTPPESRGMFCHQADAIVSYIISLAADHLPDAGQMVPSTLDMALEEIEHRLNNHDSRIDALEHAVAPEPLPSIAQLDERRWGLR